MRRECCRRWPCRFLPAVRGRLDLCSYPPSPRVFPATDAPDLLDHVIQASLVDAHKIAEFLAPHVIFPPQHHHAHLPGGPEVGIHHRPASRCPPVLLRFHHALLRIRPRILQRRLTLPV